MVKFLRRTWSRYSKLGKGRKKKQVWRRPTGRDNKMRERRKGYPAVVSVGYKTSKKDHQKIVKINTLKDFQNVSKGATVIFGKVGEKKKIEFAKLAKEKNIAISNLNIEKFLKNVKEKNDKKIAAKKKTEVKKSKKEEKVSAFKSVSSNSDKNTNEGKEKLESNDIKEDKKWI